MIRILAIRIGRRLSSTGRSDSGWALVSVIGLAAVMFIIVATALTAAQSGQKLAKTDQDAAAALAAAYAGVQEYQSRIANDPNYYEYGNPQAPFSASSANLLVLPTGSQNNPAFGIGTTGSWAQIPKTDSTAVTAAFRYEVDASAYATDGVVRLRSTGKTGTATRSVIATFKPTGFIDFLYFTDFETNDPDLVVPNGTNQHCDRYRWATPAMTSGCAVIQFGPGDVIDGPAHSNDRVSVCGGVFQQKFTTSAPAPGWSNVCGSGNTQNPFKQSIDPNTALVSMPPTNAEMQKETRPDLRTEVPRPGCLYTGPTQVTLLANGQMNIKSPLTKVTQVSETPGFPSRSPAECGDPSALRSAAGATVNVLASNLIYVQGVPAASSDPNAWPTLPDGFCRNRTTADEGWSWNGVSYPETDELRPLKSTEARPAYGCTNGDLYIKGVLKGAMTAAAQNYIYITGDITYAANSNSILGLVGNNAVWVRNPIYCNSYRANGTCSSSGSRGAATGREVWAAIVSVEHVFVVQNWDLGSNRGQLSVHGAIAQKFRGRVAASNGSRVVAGYEKDYTYDARLKTTSPPKFLTPTSVTFTVRSVATVPAAFAASGQAS